MQKKKISAEDVLAVVDFTADHDHVGAADGQLHAAGAKRGGILTAVHGVAEFAQQLPVLMAPGVGAAVEGVFVAFHQCLVTVVNAGAAGQCELQEGGGK